MHWATVDVAIPQAYLQAKQLEVVEREGCGHQPDPANAIAGQQDAVDRTVGEVPEHRVVDWLVRPATALNRVHTSISRTSPVYNQRAADTARSDSARRTYVPRSDSPGRLDAQWDRMVGAYTLTIAGRLLPSIKPLLIQWHDRTSTLCLAVGKKTKKTKTVDGSDSGPCHPARHSAHTRSKGCRR